MSEPLNVQKMRAEQEERRFEYMARNFFSRWTPQDRAEAAAFNAELFVLVRQIYHDAVTPLAEQMCLLVSGMPLNPFIPKEKK